MKVYDGNDTGAERQGLPTRDWGYVDERK